MIFKWIGLLVLAFSAWSAQAQEDLRPSSDLKAVMAEESTCLVQTVYQSPQDGRMLKSVHQAAADTCVRYGFGSMRHSAYFQQRFGGSPIDPESDEGKRWLERAKVHAKMWLALAIPVCSGTFDVQSCLKQLNL